MGDEVLQSLGAKALRIRSRARPLGRLAVAPRVFLGPFIQSLTGYRESFPYLHVGQRSSPKETPDCPRGTANIMCGFVDSKQRRRKGHRHTRAGRDNILIFHLGFFSRTRDARLPI